MTDADGITMVQIASVAQNKLVVQIVTCAGTRELLRFMTSSSSSVAAQ